MREEERRDRISAIRPEGTWHCEVCDNFVRLPVPKCDWCGERTDTFPRHAECPGLIDRCAEEGLGRAALHGLAGEVIRRLAPETEATAPALLMNLLALFGNRVGPTPRLFHAGAWHAARLNVMIVGPTSKGRKGTGTSIIRQSFPGTDRIGEIGLSSGEGLLAALQNMEQDGAAWVPIVESEFARTLRVLRRDGNPLSQVIRQLWDEGRAAVSTRKDPLRVDNAHVSIIGHITPEELAREFDGIELANGFANRFLWCWTERWHTLPDGGDPPFDEVRRLVGDALERASGVADELKWAPDAKEEWHEIYNQVTNRPRVGDWAGVAGRAEPQILRLAVIYALMDGSSRIESPHLQAAEAVWDYSDRVSARLFALSDLGRRVLNALRRHGGESSKRDLQRALGGKVRVEVLDGELARLGAMGLVEVERRSSGGRGRPSEIVRSREGVRQ